MNNTLIAIDIMNAALNTALRVSTLLQTAKNENRDVTDEEVQVLRDANDQLIQEILNS